MSTESAESTDEQLVSEAEAEAEAAQARAQAASDRVAELRRQVERESGSQPAPAGISIRRAVVSAVAAIAVAALLATTGLMLWGHHKAAARVQRAAEYAAAARQNVVNLMAIDYNTAADSVQRVLDGSVGKFHDNFAETSQDFVKALQNEKIVTKAAVNDAAVESMTDDSAVVLVSATSRREGAKVPKDQQQPRVWRVVLTLQRDNGQIKMSAVEFV